MKYTQLQTRSQNAITNYIVSNIKNLSNTQNKSQWYQTKKNGSRVDNQEGLRTTRDVTIIHNDNAMGHPKMLVDDYDRSHLNSGRASTPRQLFAFVYPNCARVRVAPLQGRVSFPPAADTRTKRKPHPLWCVSCPYTPVALGTRGQTALRCYDTSITTPISILSTRTPSIARVSLRYLLHCPPP